MSGGPPPPPPPPPPGPSLETKAPSAPAPPPPPPPISTPSAPSSAPAPPPAPAPPAEVKAPSQSKPTSAPPPPAVKMAPKVVQQPASVAAPSSSKPPDALSPSGFAKAMSASMKDSDPATAPVVASTGALYVDASDEKKDSEAVEVRAVETSDAVEFAGENVEEVAEAEAEPVAQTFADKIKNLIASLQKPKEETESTEEAKPEQKAEPETVELVHAVDEKTGEDVMVVKAEEEVEQKSVKEQLADVIDTAVVALSKAPDFRLIFVGELLLVFLCIAIWPPLVQNIGVAILFPPVLLATAAASIMWQRTPDSLPDLVSLRVPPEMSEELTLRVRQIKQKGSELDKLSQAILDVQKDVEKLIPHTDAIDVKMNTICSILDQSDNVLHEELLVVPEDVDVFEVDEEEEVVVVKPKTPKIAPRRSAPPPSDMTQFLNAMFFPSSNSADGKGVNPKNVRKKKKAAKAKAEIEKQASEAAEEATNPVLGTRRSDMSSRRGSDKKSN